MPTYKTPGVYIEEISLRPPSVAEVATAIPAFIGYTQKAKKLQDDDLMRTPTRITSMAEYKKYFGETDPLPFTINLVEDSVTGAISIKPITAPTLIYLTYYYMQMFFSNGGGPCYIVSVGNLSDPIVKGDDNSGLQGGLKLLEKEDEPTLILIPEATSLANKAHFFDLMNEALEQCNKLMDRFAIMDVYGEDTTDFRNSIRSDLGYLKYGAAYHPWLETSLSFAYDEETVKLGTHVDENGGAPGTDLNGKKLGADEVKLKKNALYNQIRAELHKLRVTLPPSAAVAGVYSRVDESRGVWKAPANVALLGVAKPTINITGDEQEDLNVDATTGKSINAIRAFTGKGILVWGARTLWAIFEPNDANTWIKVKTMIENYLILKWRDGALMGAKADDAFFVKVGQGSTMTTQDILDGRMIVEIGMAVFRPAEFIILKFSHKIIGLR
jgi:phage tail sheath protein FI